MIEKIMIVEDDILVASDIKLMLASVGYSITGMANTASKALEMFKDEIPDLVLCDINLRTKRTGIDFVEKTRKIGFVPVIYITAYADEQTIALAAHTSPESYLVKPFTRIQLLTTVKLVLEKNNGHKKNKAVFDKKFPHPSDREKQILQFLHEGLNSREISERLHISIQTVQTHRKHLLAKYKVNKVIDLLALAKQNKLIK